MGTGNAEQCTLLETLSGLTVQMSAVKLKRHLDAGPAHLICFYCSISLQKRWGEYIVTFLSIHD